MSHHLSMNQGQRQSLRQAQRLMMSPQMQQALNLLQVPIMELHALVEAELEQNPILEPIEEYEAKEDTPSEVDSGETPNQEVDQEVVIGEDDLSILLKLDQDMQDHFAESGGYAAKRSQEEEKLKNFLESSVCGKQGRFSLLMGQVAESFSQKEEIAIAEAIVGNLSDAGFLDVCLTEIAALQECSVEDVEKVLEVVQTFHPAGIAAKNPQESLLLQLKRKGKQDSVAYQIIDKFYDAMLQNKIPAIAAELKISPEKVQKVIEEQISKLDLHPGNTENAGSEQWIIPDVTIVLEKEKLVSVVPEDSMPSLRLNRRYIKMLEDPELSLETKEYIKTKILSGKWLMKNIYQRNDTLYKIADQLIATQEAFLSDPKGELVPLTMKTVADAIEVHESTVARAVSNKYISCPRGIVPLRSFFTNALTSSSGEDISSSAVKDALREILDKEDKAKPHSDETLSKMLKEKGIQCARRTVAKYRTQFGIGNASQRKVWKN